MGYLPIRKRDNGPLYDVNMNRMLKELYSGMKVPHAENVVKEQYGDTVSVLAASENVGKFGRTTTAVGTSFATVGQFQDAVADETFVSTNIIDSIVSTSGSDTQVMTIEGFTIDGSGNLTAVSQDATLTGQAEVTLGTPLARATRMYVKPSGTFDSPPSALVGDVAVYDNTDGITSGKPNTDAAVKLIIEAADTQTQKCATCTDSLHYLFIQTVRVGCDAAAQTAAYVNFRFETLDITGGGAWRPLGADLVVAKDKNELEVKIDPLLIVPPSHDVRIRAKTNTSTAQVIAQFSGVLAEVQ